VAAVGRDRGHIDNQGELTVRGVPRSFTNGAVLAASCREEGVTLITRNRRDFERIQRLERFRFADPWPDV
jgi:predicted nucleic acid-binding protein